MSLGKHKYYCEMCKKQCKDDNSLQQHKRSLFHQQRMIEFNEDPERYMERFSIDFETKFTDMFRTKYGFQNFIPINKAYNEYIKDAYHVHLNSTIWESLTDFAQHLSESGWWEVHKENVGEIETYTIKLIDPDAEKKQAEQEKKLNLREIEKKRESKELEKLIKKANKIKQQQQQHQSLILTPQTEQFQQKDQPIELTIQSQDRITQKSNPFGKVQQFSAQDDSNKKMLEQLKQKEQKSNIDKLLERQKHKLIPKQQFVQEKTIWVQEGLIVRIKNDHSKHNKEKGEVIRARDKNSILVQFPNKEKVEFKESELSIILPAEGGRVMILDLKEKGRIVKIDMSQKQVDVELDKDKQIVKLRFDDVCKISQ